MSRPRLDVLDRLEIAGYGDLRVCNCAACHSLLAGGGQDESLAKMGRDQAAKYFPAGGVRAWIAGRPYCRRCAKGLWRPVDAAAPAV